MFKKVKVIITIVMPNNSLQKIKAVMLDSSYNKLKNTLEDENKKQVKFTDSEEGIVTVINMDQISMIQVKIDESE